jgi:hypothetical protein
MRSSFDGFYTPTEAQYQALWRDALIVLDANVLLNLYRIPTTARDELLNVLELLKDRIWIPHQVALEFQRNRLTVIWSERKMTEDALSGASSLVGGISQKVDALQIDKRGLGITPAPLIKELSDANAKLLEAIQAVQGSQLDISSVDPLRDRLDNLLEGRVGPGPKNQQQLDELIKDGDQRFEKRIPPGYEDAEKDKKPSDGTFIFDHLLYQRKFGDLILWRQLLAHLNATDVKSVLLITADQKEDWWWKVQGRTLGAHPELVREILRTTSIDLFWMYSSVQFVEQAKKYAGANVSSQSVQELEQIVELQSLPTVSISTIDFVNKWSHNSETPISEYQDALVAVHQWLSRHRKDVRQGQSFPDFVIYNKDKKHGFEVKYLRNFERMLFPPGATASVLRGYLETKERRLDTFTMIAVIPSDDLFEIVGTERKADLRRRIARFLARYPIDGVIVASVVGDDLEVLTVVSRKGLPLEDEEADENGYSDEE